MNQRCWVFALSTFCVALLGALSAGCSQEDANPTPTPARVATSVSPQQLKQLLDSDAEILVLDVRSREEHATGHIAGAVNIPHSEIPSRLDELAAYRDKHVIVCCWAGGRAAAAKEFLRNAGFASLLDLQGHMAAWEQLGYPVESGATQ